MMYRLVIPGAIEDVKEIRVLEWHRRPSEPFAKDDLVVELETAKAVVEVRAGQAGVVRKVYVEDGEWQQIGGVLAVASDTADEPMPAELGAHGALMLADFEIT